MLKYIVAAIAAVLLIIGVAAVVSNSGSTTDLRDNASSAVDAGVDMPMPTNYLVDMSNVLSEEQVKLLQEKLKKADTEKMQIGVAIIPSTGSLTAQEYSIRLAEKWKVGDKNTDNGAIILIVTGDRKVQIEIGSGLEGSIPDAEVGRILDEQMVPFLKKQNWYGAVDVAIDGLQTAAAN